MTDRLEKIFSTLKPCKVFADIGCDHGCIAKAMLDEKVCEKVIISDISEKCLKKAEVLLGDYIESGRAESVVSDGFNGLGWCDQALVAGMGGEEIVGIIESAKTQNKLPERLVLQPMKNCDKVRLCAVTAGYKVVSDKVFKSGGKFYNLIVLTFGNDSLTEEEIAFGRDNIKELPEDFREMMAVEVQRLENAKKNCGDNQSACAQIDEKLKKIEKYV